MKEKYKALNPLSSTPLHPPPSGLPESTALLHHARRTGPTLRVYPVVLMVVKRYLRNNART